MRLDRNKRLRHELLVFCECAHCSLLAGGVPVEGEDDLPLHLIVVHQQASQHLDVICPESGAARRDSSRHSGEVTGHDVGVALDNDRLLVF